ncbi:porin [Azospirillum halopraeferens]|uniref:porin n=1 Tax=Azospirillum halopraeferens TaxID=34010 RepID=UPI000414F681|nr:porin [Azospirillum halopraeferens]
MNRSLLLGCTAVVAAAISGPALAQAKFDVTIGGDAYFQGGYVDHDLDAGERSTEFRNRFRVNIIPTAKADNGLEYGGHVRIRANRDDAAVDGDRAYLFVQGAFGTVQAGVVNGLSDEYGVIGPNVEGIAGGPDNSTLDFVPNAALPANAMNFRNLASGDAGTKIVYLTPSFSGFQAGASYMPRTGNVNNSINLSKTEAFGDLRAMTYTDVFEVGGLYRGEFGAVTVEASAFYEFGQAMDQVEPTMRYAYDDLSSFSAGVNVGYMGFAVGGFYAYHGDSGYCKTTAGCISREDQHVWSLNAQYGFGDVIVAGSYLNARDAGDMTVAGRSKLDLWQAGVTYAVAPGLTVGLEYSYFDLDADVAANSTNGSIVMLDTRLAF